MPPRFLVPLCWTLWGILLAGLLYWLVRVSTERTSSPEAGRGLGLFLVLAMMVLLAGAGFAVRWAARKQSTGWLVTLAIVLAYPIVPAVARPIVLGLEERRFAADEARVGDFGDSTLAAMADAIRESDTTTLRQLLNGQRPPGGKDRAGNDLLAYAVGIVRATGRGVEAVRTLLDAGADPRTSRTADGVDLVNYVIVGSPPGSAELVRLLLDHRADPNAVDAQTGDTPIRKIYDNDVAMLRSLVEHGADIDRVQSDGVPAVVHFIATRQWECALYLIEKGAALDVRNADGLSVDYYLQDWKDSVYGEHPEGWNRVRQAIERRRVQSS